MKQDMLRYNAVKSSFRITCGANRLTLHFVLAAVLCSGCRDNEPLERPSSRDRGVQRVVAFTPPRFDQGAVAVSYRAEGAQTYPADTTTAQICHRILMRIYEYEDRERLFVAGRVSAAPNLVIRYLGPARDAEEGVLAWVGCYLGEDSGLAEFDRRLYPLSMLDIQDIKAIVAIYESTAGLR